jgi:ferrous iron transport protein A
LQQEGRKIMPNQPHHQQQRHRHQHHGGRENHRQERLIMPLAKAQVEDQLWIAGYKSKDGVNRLVGMGLAPGMKIKVLQNLAGNIVVGVGETRIGIDDGMAKRILVSDQPTL